MCVSCLHSRQLTFSHSGFAHRNSRSSSTGAQIAAKSQKGQLVRSSKSASLISSCCCRRSSVSIVFWSRNRHICSFANPALQPLPSMHRSLYFEFPISLLALRLAHSRQKKCGSSPSQCVALLKGNSSKQQARGNLGTDAVSRVEYSVQHSIIIPFSRCSLSLVASASSSSFWSCRLAIVAVVSQSYASESTRLKRLTIFLPSFFACSFKLFQQVRTI